MLRTLYDRTLHFAGHKYAPLALFILAFIESSFFLIPPDVLLMPMVLAAFHRAFYFAFICTVGSVLGGIFGYYLGYLAYDSLGVAVIEFYHAQDKMAWLQELYNSYGVWVVFTAGFTPIPYKVFTILSGVMQMPLLEFTLASLASRGARFFLIAGILWYGGATLKGWIEKNFGWLSIAGVVGLVLLVLLKLALFG